MSKTEFQEYENIWQQNDIRLTGTGDMASRSGLTGGVSNKFPFT